MADSKLITFAVVGVLIGAAIGVGIGFAVFGNNKAEEQTYWFYIDYGDKADASHVNGWVDVKAANLPDAVKKIPGVKTSESATYGLSLDGINGVDSGANMGDPYWGQYIRNGDYYGATDFEKNFSFSNFGLGGTYCTVMYFAYGTGTIPTDTGWKTTGPFAS